MKYVCHRAESVEGMTDWLNGLLEEFDYVDVSLSTDLCRAICYVWDEEYS